MKIVALEKLLEREVERKDFLLYIGMFLLAFTSISSILKSISETGNTAMDTTTSQGFGSGMYGGVPTKGDKLDG